MFLVLQFSLRHQILKRVLSIVYIYSSCYSSIPLTSVFLGRNDGLSTLCHSCGFNYQHQQRVLKTFPGPGYLLDSYIYWYIYIYIYIYIYTNIPVNAMVRLPHPRSGNSQGQETFLAPCANKQTRNYDIECSNRHSYLSNLRLKGLSRSKMKWWAMYIQIYQWMP